MNLLTSSRLPCPICGTHKIRVTKDLQECDYCRTIRNSRRKRRTDLRRTLTHRTMAWLIAERTRAADLMLTHYAAWQRLGPEPLPRGRKTLEKLQIQLDAVDVLQSELARRYTAGAVLGQLTAIPKRRAVSMRKRLFADLATNRITVADLQLPKHHLGEQQALLDATHAIGIFTAQYGHRVAQRAFDRTAVPVSLSWQAATAHLPGLASAAQRFALPPAQARDQFDVIVALTKELDAARA